MDDGLTPPRANWSAQDLFNEACSAADATHATDLSHKEAIARALCLTLRLIEDWRGEHRAEINDYLGPRAPKDGKDDVLAIVKFVFARQDRRQWNWHANALKQAISEGKRSDDLTAYFKITPPTNAAKMWSKAHPKPGGKATLAAKPATAKVTQPATVVPEGYELVSSAHLLKLASMVEAATEFTSALGASYLAMADVVARQQQELATVSQAEA
jgi:hypothetical protein